MSNQPKISPFYNNKMSIDKDRFKELLDFLNMKAGILICLDETVPCIPCQNKDTHEHKIDIISTGIPQDQVASIMRGFANIIDKRNNPQQNNSDNVDKGV